MKINWAFVKSAAEATLKFLEANKDTIVVSGLVATWVAAVAKMASCEAPSVPVKPLSNPIYQPESVSNRITYDANDLHCAAIAAIYRRYKDALSSTKIAAATQIVNIVKANPTSAHITFAIKVLEALSEDMLTSNARAVTSMIQELATMEVSANDNGGAEEP